MLKKIVIPAVALLFIATVSLGQSAEEIVNKHIEVMGGKAKLSELKTLKVVANVDIGPNMKAPITMYFANNKSMRTEVEVQGMKMVQAVDGDSGWYINPFGGKMEAERMDKEMMRQAKDQMDIAGSLFDYKTKGHTVEYIGKDDMEGTDTYKLKVTKKEGVVEYHYLDAATYLPLKVTSKHKFEDKEIESEMLPSDYRKVDGIMFPYTIEMREPESSQGQAITTVSVEVNPTVDAAMFKLPAKTK